MKNVVAIGLTAVCGTCLGAADSAWNQPLGGNWGNAFNWTPNVVPQLLGDTADISIPGGYLVVLDVPVRLSSLQILNPSAVLRLDQQLRISTGTLQNSGEVRVAGTGSIQSDAAYFAGTGRIVMDGATISGAFTHYPPHTIQGTGILASPITNQGTIRALGGTLIVAAGGTNDGRIESSTDSLLDVRDRIYQTDGQITADGGEVRFTAAGVIGGRLATVGAGHIDTYGTITMRPTHMTGTVNIHEGSVMKLGAPPQLVSGVITLNPEAGPAITSLSLEWSDVQDPFRDCTIVMNSPPGTASTGINTTLPQSCVAVMSDTTTIMGNGVISATIINRGNILASGLGNRISTRHVTNEGSILAEAGGTTSFATVVQSQDGIIIADGGVNEFSGIGDRSGGTVVARNGGLNRASNGTFTNIALIGPTVVPTGASTTIYNGVQLEGTLTVNDAGSADGTSRLLAPEQSWGQLAGLNSGGRVVLNGPPGRPDAAVVAGVQGIAFGPGIVLTGNGEVQCAINNRGLIECLGPGNVINIAIGPSTYNEGEIVAASGGHVSLTGSHLHQTTTGRVRADGSEILVNGSTVFGGTIVHGGRIDALNGGWIRVHGEATFQDGLASSGELRVPSGSKLTVASAPASHSGDIVVNDGSGAAAAQVRISSVQVQGGPRFVLRASPSDPGTALLTLRTGGTTMDAAASIVGRGRLTGTGAMNGTISPGESAAPFGTLTCDGYLQLDSTSHTNIEFGGTAPDQRDRINGNGTLRLNAGTLHVAFAEQFLPGLGDTFAIISGPSVSGAFGVTELPDLSAANLKLAVIYAPTQVLLTTVCLADFNGNGSVDFFDYLDFAQAFSSEDPAADFDGNGQVDFFDYLDFVAAFDTGCD
jgi:hypothetical protein